MHGLGWSHQKPERRAGERDEQAIARWMRTQWPRVKNATRDVVETAKKAEVRVEVVGHK